RKPPARRGGREACATLLLRPRDLRRLLRVRNSVVYLQPVECCGLFGIQPEFLGFFDEELALFQVVVDTAGFDLFAQALAFRWRFRLSDSIVPLDPLFLAL